MGAILDAGGVDWRYPRVMNRYTHITVGLVFLVLAMAIGGCSSGVLVPTFSAEGVRELETVDGRSQVVFLINAKNPNQEPIPLEQVNYRVLIDGQQVFAGVRSPETTLPGYGSLYFDLPAVVETEVLKSGRVVSYAIDGSVKYHIPGAFAEVLYDADIKVPEAPLQIQGVLNLGHEEEVE